jgi:hypothetical protein
VTRPTVDRYGNLTPASNSLMSGVEASPSVAVTTIGVAD